MAWIIDSIEAQTNFGDAPEPLAIEPRNQVDREQLSGWVTVVGLHGNAAQYTVEIEISRGDLEIRSVQFEPLDGKITSTLFRDFQMNQLMDQVNEFLDREFPRTQKLVQTYDVKLIANQWPNGDLEALFTVIKWIYNRANEQRKPATMAVANQLGVSRATASRMIKAARDAGYELASPAPYKGSSGTNGKKKASDR